MKQSGILPENRVALFVDGDNLAPSLAGSILEAAARVGRPDLRRVYAAEAGFRAWAGAPGFRAIQVGGAKNGTDLLLCIDAVELACQADFSAFVIASDDRDFSHLAHWLRERGHHVSGLGTRKAPEDWRAACSIFQTLDEETTSCPASPAPVRKVEPPSKIDHQVRDLIREEGQGGSMEVGRIGGRMGSQHKVTLERLGTTNWRQYLSARGHLYALDPKGPGARVRWIGS